MWESTGDSSLLIGTLGFVVVIVLLLVFIGKRTSVNIPLISLPKALDITVATSSPEQIIINENMMFAFDSDSDSDSDSDGDEMFALEVVVDLCLLSANDGQDTRITARSVSLQIDPIGEAWICGHEQDKSARMWFHRNKREGLQVQASSVLQGQKVAAGRIFIRFETNSAIPERVPVARLVLSYKDRHGKGMEQERQCCASVPKRLRKDLGRPVEAKRSRARAAPQEAPRDVRAATVGTRLEKGRGVAAEEERGASKAPVKDEARGADEAPAKEERRGATKAVKEGHEQCKGSSAHGADKTIPMENKLKARTMTVEAHEPETQEADERTTGVHTADTGLFWEPDESGVPDDKEWKRLRSLRKKLRQIANLREKKDRGCILTENQEAKIEREGCIQKELAAMT